MNISLTPDMVQALRKAAFDVPNREPELTAAAVLLGCLELGDTAAVREPVELIPGYPPRIQCVDCPGFESEMCCAKSILDTEQ